MMHAQSERTRGNVIGAFLSVADPEILVGGAEIAHNYFRPRPLSQILLPANEIETAERPENLAEGGRCA